MVSFSISQDEEDSVSCGSSYGTIASYNLDFDASKYAYCTMAGNVIFEFVAYSSGKYNQVDSESFEITSDELIYNADSAEHKEYISSGSASYNGCRFKYTSSSFDIKAICGNSSSSYSSSKIRGYIYSSQFTAVFHN